MNAEEYTKELDFSAVSTVKKFEDELRVVRSNRPSVELVENVPVAYYGENLSIKQLASIAIGAQKELLITVWDKNALGPVMTGIQSANIGLSLQNDGNVIRATLPPLSAERREEFQKIVKRMAEETRIKLRTLRDEVLKKIKSAGDSGGITEDQVFDAKEKIQKMIDDSNKKIETALQAKIKELSE